MQRSVGIFLILHFQCFLYTNDNEVQGLQSLQGQDLNFKKLPRSKKPSTLNDLKYIYALVSSALDDASKSSHNKFPVDLPVGTVQKQKDCATHLKQPCVPKTHKTQKMQHFPFIFIFLQSIHCRQMSEFGWRAVGCEGFKKYLKAIGKNRVTCASSS